MSDTQKPAEGTPAPAPDTETPAPAAPAAAPDAPSAPADTTEDIVTEAPAPPAEESAKDETKKVTPLTEATLSYHPPIVGKDVFKKARQFIARGEHYFWFTDDAVEIKALHKALKNGNVDDATAAWASQTGKGLLFWTKRREDKATPHGVINLSEVTMAEPGVGAGVGDFAFTVNGHKHTFAARTADTRAGWLAALEPKIEEAKGQKTVVEESDGYKAELEKLTKPSAPVAAAPKKSSESKAKEPVKDKADDETTPAETSRSVSATRRRMSKFGNILGRKEEPEEKKKEEEKEGKDETKAPAEVTPAAESSGAAAEPAAAAEPTPEAPAAEPSEGKKAETPKSARRVSTYFVNLLKSGGQGEKAEKDKDAGPAKDTEATPPVSSTAPQLDPVDPSASKPIEPETVTSPEATEPPQDTKDVKDAAAEEPAATPEPLVKEKRRGSFFGAVQRSMSRVMKPKEKAVAAPAEPAAAPESAEKPEPETAAPAEGGPSVNGTEAPEEKKETVADAPAPAAGASSQPVQA